LADPLISYAAVYFLIPLLRVSLSWFLYYFFQNICCSVYRTKQDRKWKCYTKNYENCTIDATIFNLFMFFCVWSEKKLKGSWKKLFFFFNIFCVTLCCLSWYNVLLEWDPIFWKPKPGVANDIALAWWGVGGLWCRGSNFNPSHNAKWVLYFYSVIMQMNYYCMPIQQMEIITTTTVSECTWIMKQLQDSCNAMYCRNMVCLKCIIVNTLHKGDNE